MNDDEKTDEEKEEEARFFILLDDVISDQRLKYDEALMELFVAGRHYKLFVLITTQYAKAITPTLRGNTDYCFMMKTIQQRQLEALWEDFGSFLTKDAFAAVINQYTEDNECLVINTCPECEVDPLQMLYWWKAVDPGEFKMGSKEYWRSAMLGASLIPPQGKSESATELLSTPVRGAPAPRADEHGGHFALGFLRDVGHCSGHCMNVLQNLNISRRAMSTPCDAWVPPSPRVVRCRITST